jgi:diguanylate cyclase (GGDEF)-like protein
LPGKLTEILGSGKKKKGAVIQLHLEEFKSFNDTFGYEFGGLFLKEIAKYLCEIKGADVYRIAGVDFVVIMEDAARPIVDRILEEIVERFDNSWHINNLDCMCSVNIGISWFPGYADSADEMLENLNHAVNESAKQGQNQIIAYNEDLMRKVFRKNSIARRIPEALQKGAVELRYRPTYQTKTGRCARADCYMRLISDEFGIIQSKEFIPIAEASGQIGAVSHYAITKTCELIKALIEDGKEFETIAVPISPIQFLQEHFCEDVTSIIKTTGIPANRLAFEVTESVTLNAFSSAQINIQKLSDLGIEVVLTEFGTGYSGLNSILSMPVDVVKLERLLIWQLDNDPRGPHLVGGLIHIAKNLGVKIVAEGVETEEQVRLLKELGCEYEQGFYYSPTLTAAELKDCFDDDKQLSSE